MFKSVTIEPRPNNEQYGWAVKFKINDTMVREVGYMALEEAFKAAKHWLVYAED